MERAVCAGAPQAVIMTDGADCTPVQNAPEWRIIHMYGAIIGDLVGFPYEYEHEDLTDRNIPLFPEKQAGYASGAKDGAAKEGKDYSDKTVLAAAAGLRKKEKTIRTKQSWRQLWKRGFCSLKEGSPKSLPEREIRLEEKKRKYPAKTAIRVKTGRTGRPSSQWAAQRHRLRRFRRMHLKKTIRKNCQKPCGTSDRNIRLPDIRWI